jgi:hypothetical protein
MCILVEVLDIGRLRGPARRHGLLHGRDGEGTGHGANVSRWEREGGRNDDDTSPGPDLEQTVRVWLTHSGQQKDGGRGV